jgi:predicted RNase H-like HicB family nuclease
MHDRSQPIFRSSDDSSRIGNIERMTSKHTYTVTVEQDDEGWFIATCPALNHVASQGRTQQEALGNVKEAMEVYIETLREHGDPIPPPRPVSTEEIDLADTFDVAV